MPGAYRISDDEAIEADSRGPWAATANMMLGGMFATLLIFQLESSGGTFPGLETALFVLIISALLSISRLEWRKSALNFYGFSTALTTSFVLISESKLSGLAASVAIVATGFVTLYFNALDNNRTQPISTQLRIEPSVSAQDDRRAR